MVIGGVDVYPGRPCPHSTGQGCDDYGNRPKDPCINFSCGWIIENSPLPDWMKPSDAKVIVIFNKLEWQGLPVDLAVPVGKRIPPRALEWLKKFAEKSMRPLLYAEQTVIDGEFQREQDLFGYGPPAFRAQVAQWQEAGTKLW
jgi:hypothetical protein